MGRRSRKSSTKSKSEKEVGNVSENECALCKTDKMSVMIGYSVRFATMERTWNI